MLLHFVAALVAFAINGVSCDVVQLPVRFVKFQTISRRYIGMQEVQVKSVDGANIAAGSLVTISASVGPQLGYGVYSEIVDGLWSYTSNENSVVSSDGTTPWIELDLGSSFINLSWLNIYVAYHTWDGSNGYNPDWCPGESVSFFDASHNLLATASLPSCTSWINVPMPYSIDLASLFQTFITPSPTPTPSNTPNPSCLPTAFRPLPGSDLGGALLSTSLGATPYEHECALTCCANPECQGYTWGAPALLPTNPCFLLTNVTTYTLSHLLTSGVLLSSNPSGAPPL